MKKFLLLTFLCVGCAAEPKVVRYEGGPTVCPPPPPAPTCTDKILSLSEEDLKAGFTCPANTRLVFPTSYIRSEKLLVMCQCK